ncbi:DUF1134 domain-containing protein [Aurantiacibacter poecillastricola]|uniref:DUF1134 domain-containing protein n=1 Tax=Aurantiacibacter poecillastricola TaxID=3064385 RepID=UPI00273D021E|nr:DUF1134 domain-containing protein [Aurantiacibacter sp. 219JJ12-13]MDP5263200.1 DUF1134 domain-containing protein [Aurantiacibacter sp. 219JJ12-13]
MQSIRKYLAAALLPALAVLALPAAAQGIQTVDPDAAIDGDLVGSGESAQPGFGTPDAGQGGELPARDEPDTGSAYDGAYSQTEPDSRYDNVDSVPQTDTAPRPSTQATVAAADPSTTYAEDDLIGAAEGLFGRGAEGLARMIQDILSEQGEPNGYIVGREGGGAFVLGVRYGSGTLYHKVEGNMPVYWTGPSIGLDAGANAGNTFVLVYNLHDTDELYERFPAGEGQAYFVGGFNASYVRKGDVVLIPIRVGAGLRLGVNAGYMRFSRKQRWLPF